MFDLGWSEMLLIGVVALIVVGPKELPGLFRQIGLFMGKARGIAREFTRAMEAAADEAGMKDIDRTIRAAANPVKFGTNSLRDAALGKPAASTAAKVPAAGTPLDPGEPIKPASATETLAAERAAEGARLREAAAQRTAERAAAGATAPGMAAPAPAATPAPASTDETA